MANKNDKLVVAYFVNIPTATGAAQQLVAWDEADDEIKLGAVAVLGYDPRTDELKANEFGARETGKGALWGTAIGATLGLLTGGIALIPGLIIGAGTGAALGHLDHKEVVMTDAEQADMLQRVRHGAGAVAVMADDFETIPVATFLERLGGDVLDFTLPEETAAAVTSAAKAQLTAAEAVQETLAESIGDEELEERIVAAQLGEMSAEESAVVHSLAAVGALSAADAAGLQNAGIEQVSTFLARGATPQGRAELAAASGVPEATILAAIREMDLMRINGVGTKYAALLVAAGVDSVGDLAMRHGGNLAQKLAEVNAREGLVENLPSAETLDGWIAQAQTLPQMIM